MSIANQMRTYLAEVKEADMLIDEKTHKMLGCVENDDDVMLNNHKYMKDILISFRNERMNMLSKLSHEAWDEL